MSYFPILSAPECTGETYLHNFPPNDWESFHPRAKIVNLTWASGNQWYSKPMGRLAFGESLLVNRNDVIDDLPDGVLPLLSLTDTPLPANLSELPILTEETYVPNWRATLRLNSSKGTTCYQGEINPFPKNASLLSFVPFMQYSNNAKNYLLFLNIEKSALPRTSEISILDAGELKKPKLTSTLQNNRLTAVSLDGLGFTADNLPVVISKGMTGIPLYLSGNDDMSKMSLEHSHPPISYAIHGDRLRAQKDLKKRWLGIVK